MRQPIRISSVTYTREHALLLRWSNDREFTVDLRELIFRLKGLRPLRDVDLFALVEVSAGGQGVSWPDGQQLGADRLWQIALEQAGRADAAEFIRWRARHGLSLTAAAQALGLSRRQIAYYASGEHPVPRTVLLACKGWEVEQQMARAGEAAHFE